MEIEEPLVFVVTGPLRTLWLLYCTIWTATCFDQLWSLSSSDLTKNWLCFPARSFPYQNEISNIIKAQKIEINVQAVDLLPPLLPCSCPPPCPCPPFKSSLGEGLPCLVFPLLSLQACERHQPGEWCLVEFTFAVQKDVCLTGTDPHRFVHLSL